MTIDPRTRRVIRDTHRELQEAKHAAEQVTRPDGTDGTGHPGIRAANLEGYLGRYTLPLLNELERAETRLARYEARAAETKSLRWRVLVFMAVVVGAAFLPSPWAILAAVAAYLVFVFPAIRKPV